MTAPLRLHGYPVSNYFNAIRAALIEKQCAFDIVTTRASQAPAFLLLSPMGKIPVLETAHGFLAETVAILEYLEDTQPGRPLHPADPFQRARARQVINIVQMYVEAPVRSLFPGVFGAVSGAELNSAALTESVRLMLARATAALAHLGLPRGYLLGEQLSYADLFAYYCFDIADRVTRFVYGRSLLLDCPGLADWFARMGELPSTPVVMADFERAFAGWVAERNSPYRNSIMEGKSCVT